MNIDIIIEVLILLGLANGAPILAARIFGTWFDIPIDRGWLAADGRALLGPSKTWRGILSAYLLTVPIAAGLGFSLPMALMLVSLSMLGDLMSSFIKRRRGLKSSSRAIGLDQIPEAGLPTLFLFLTSNLAALDGVVIVVLFIVAEVLLSKVLYRWHIRKRPY